MPPSDEFIANIQENLKNDSNPIESDPSLSEIWSIMYLEAKHYMKTGNKERACYLMTELSKTSDFALFDLAAIHSLSCCLSKKEDIEGLKEKEASIPFWYKEVFFNISLDLSRSFKDRANQGYFALLLSSLEKNQDKKISLLKEAYQYGIPEIKEKANEQLSKLLPSKYKISTALLKGEDLARNFARNREFPQARKIYRKLMNDKNSSFETRLNTWELFRNTYKLERNDALYIKETNNMLNFINNERKKDPENEVYNSAFNNLTLKKARIYWTKNNNKMAKKVFTDFFKNPNISPRLLSEAFYILGRMDIETRNYKNAQTQFLKAEEYRYNDSEFRERLIWQIAWTYYYHLKDYGKAKETFEELVDEASSSSLRFQYLYWFALTHKKLGNLEEAKSILEDLSKDDIYGLYGILSHKELKKPLPPLESHQETKYVPEIFAWLISMNEKDLALNYLNSYMYKGSSAGYILDHLSLYTKVEGAQGGIVQFNRLSAKNKDYVIGKMSHIAYPRPYQDLVNENSSKVDISPEIIYSIMRQESVFNPVIKSPADAYGLMQLIPETALSMAKEHDVSSYQDYTDLYYPEINIELGSHYLSSLKRRFKHFALATASYNAGETAVENWKKLYLTKDEDADLEFIELIPYAETQKYVKLVLRNYINYLRSKSQEAFLFPEDFFTEKF